MNIFIKKQEKQYKKYKKLFNQKDSEALFQEIKFLKELNNPKYSEFYDLIKSIKINNYNVELEGILNYLTIIKLKDNKILSFFDKNDYSNFESDLNNFIEKINKDINFFKTFEDKSNKPLLNSIACLVGLACGDALGTTLEFTQPDPDVFIDEIVGGGVFKLKAGEWTDDMSMALCISKSLLEHGFSLKKQMENYVQWMRYGYLSSNGRCFDVGVTTSNAIKKYLHMQDPVAGSKEVYHSGNGSIMRLAPIPIFYHNNINDTIKFSGESSITTHGSNECIESCMLLGAILNLFINNNGKSKEDILFNSNLDKILINQFNIKEQKVIDLLTGHSWLNLEYKDLPNSGYVIDTLISSLWCFYYGVFIILIILKMLLLKLLIFVVTLILLVLFVDNYLGLIMDIMIFHKTGLKYLVNLLIYKKKLIIYLKNKLLVSIYLIINFLFLKVYRKCYILRFAYNQKMPEGMNYHQKHRNEIDLTMILLLLLI